jgi:DNA-binding beta-propeller fold protein YncE
MTIIWGAISGSAAIAGAFVAAFRIAKKVVKGPDSRPSISLDDMILPISVGVGHFLRRRILSGTISVIFLAIGILVVSLQIWPELQPTTSSSVIVVNLKGKKAGFDKKIYIADRNNGRLLVFSSSNINQPLPPIPIGAKGNIEGRGAPEGMIELERDPLHLIFVADTSNDKIHIVDVDSNTEIQPGLAVGMSPRSMVITPDHLKLFVSYEQPAPNGGIMVFDISSDDPKNFHFVSNMTGAVSCPEGIALSPLGDRLYVATQCGGDKDPVFVMDTSTNAVLRSIPGLAVGTGVAVDGNGHNLFVSRGNFPCIISDKKEIGSPMTVVDTKTLSVKYTICLHMSVGAMAISRDIAEKHLFVWGGRKFSIADWLADWLVPPRAGQQYLFVANGKTLSVFDTANLDTCRKPTLDIPLESSIQGIGIADDGSVYAFMPGSMRLFLYSPTGLTGCDDVAAGR